MDFNAEAMTLLINGIAVVLGCSTINHRIKALEKRMEQYNLTVERLAKVEESAKSAHLRLDGLERRIDCD